MLKQNFFNQYAGLRATIIALGGFIIAVLMGCGIPQNQPNGEFKLPPFPKTTPMPIPVTPTPLSVSDILPTPSPTITKVVRVVGDLLDAQTADSYSQSAILLSEYRNLTSDKSTRPLADKIELRSDSSVWIKVGNEPLSNISNVWVDIGADQFTSDIYTSKVSSLDNFTLKSNYNVKVFPSSTIDNRLSSESTLLALHIIEPVDQALLSDRVTFRWVLTPDINPLAEHLFFELVFWEVGEDPVLDGFSPSGASQYSHVDVNMTDALKYISRLHPNVVYEWGILLVALDPYRRVAYLGGGNRFIIRPDPKVNNFEKPVVTSTPRG